MAVQAITRRGFFAALAAVPVAVKAVMAAPAPPQLMFHPDAFSLAMQPAHVQRLDVMYGWAAVRPELACRIMND